MCLIIFCPKGTEKKSEFLFESIRKASLTNKDGIGLMYKEEDKIYVSKGYTDVEEFIQKLNELRFSDENGQLAIHLRIGNKGAINQQMCHPFICSNDDEEIMLTETYTDRPVLMHNGTFIGLTLPAGKSDTFVFTKKFLSNNVLNGLFYDNLELFNEVFKTTLSVSRLLMFYPDERDYQKTGNWIESNGYYFSNETFKNSNIRDVGGQTETVKETATLSLPAHGRQTYAQKQQRNFNATGMSATSAPDFSTNSNRKLRTDYLKSVILNTIIGKTFEDKLGYIYNTYRGLYASNDKPYHSDELSLEFFVNKYNFKFAVLQAKITNLTYGIVDNVYYKIERILTKENDNQQTYAVLSRQVGISSSPIFMPLEEVSNYFSVRPQNTTVSLAMFRSYLDAVSLLKDHKKSINRYLNAIKKKDDFVMVTIGDKRNKYTFPAIVIKWFIYETKLDHGADINKIKLMLSNV